MLSTKYKLCPSSAHAVLLCYLLVITFSKKVVIAMLNKNTKNFDIS